MLFYQIYQILITLSLYDFVSYSFSLTSRHGKEGQLPEGRGRGVRTASVRYMQITVLGGIILAELSFEV